MPPRNLVNLKDVSKSYSSRTILDAVTLGVNDGDRIGVVGRNGDGKTTLLRLIAGGEEPDSGKVTKAGDCSIAMLDQSDGLDPQESVRELLHGVRPGHELAADPAYRSILEGLLGGVASDRFTDGLDTKVGRLSGGERRRVALARTLLASPELLLLDEPTNHLDVEGVDWLARHLNARSGALVVITHDRWFLDAVCESTWEVADRAVHQYEGGYAAYVLAKAERDRQDAARETRRRALIRKELAWLRRGPPARTTKPKFRVDAANALIADEPPARNSAQLLQFATARLGKRVIDAIKISFAYDGRRLLDQVTWRLGPGDRIGLVGVNGAGKTTLLKLMAGHLQPDAGSVKFGQTIRIAELSQDAAELPEQLNVFEALEDAKIVATLSEGREITSKQLCERFGFEGSRARTPVSDLSGGERRRLQLMRLLMGEPNVLFLDEPTNDLDIETLNALEDLLDNWPGTLIVVSHDRYFIERVCDDVWGLMGDGALRHLGGGIEQYVRLRQEQDEAAAAADGLAPRGESEMTPGARKLAERKQRREIEKTIRRLDRELQKLDDRQQAIAAEMEAAATDHELLGALQKEVDEITTRRERLEAEWLAQSEQLEAVASE